MKINIKKDKDKKIDVLGIGLNAVDFLCVIPSFPEYETKLKMIDYSIQGGGQVATALVALSKWGLKTKYLGKFGSDYFGNFSKKSLEKEDVDVEDSLIIEGARNQIAFIMVDRGTGERTIVWYRDEKLNFFPDDFDVNLILKSKVLLVDGHNEEAAIYYSSFAKENNVPVVADVERVKENTEKLIENVDFLVTSSNFPQEFSGKKDLEKSLKELKKFGPVLVAITLGKDGSIAHYKDEIIRTPGYKIDAVDTTGAGDVFHAGFIYGLLNGFELRELLKFSNAVAALKCREIGGRKGIPSVPEALSFMNKN
ncbi:MAG: PfkB family carbohydrate kinase [Acidobacteriota bacterium]